MKTNMIAKHLIIGDQCRKNRGDLGAINEAMARIVKEFLESAQYWPLGHGTTFHVKLEIEKAE